MRTLDKVIKAHEICIERIRQGEENCPAECPFVSCCDPERRTLELDALHYLKELQGLSKMWNDKLDKEQENQPLDWETLKQMEGKPVWVEADYFEKGWFLVDASLVDIWVIGYDCAEHQLREEDIGVSWQAYRKERS